MASLNDIMIRLRVDGKDVDTSLQSLKKKLTDLDKDSKKSGESLGDMFDKLRSGYLAVTAAVGGIVVGIASTINAASNLEEVQNKFNVVFSGMEERAEDMAKNLVDNYLMSETAAKKYLSAVQDLLVPMGMNKQAAMNMSESIVQLSADLGSFNNLSTEEVMNDIQSALVGNYQTMKKYGVVLNETRVQQEAMNQGLWNGKGVIDANVKAQVAFTLITKDSAAAVGDITRSSDSYANTQKLLTARFEDLQVKIGRLFLPVAKNLLTVILNLVDAFSTFADWVQKIIGHFDQGTASIKEFKNQLKAIEDIPLENKLAELTAEAEKMNAELSKLQELDKYAATGFAGISGYSTEIARLTSELQRNKNEQSAIIEELKKRKKAEEETISAAANAEERRKYLTEEERKYLIDVFNLKQGQREIEFQNELQAIENKRQFLEYLRQMEQGYINLKQKEYYDSQIEQIELDEETIDMKYQLGLMDYQQYSDLLNMRLAVAKQVYGVESVEYLKLLRKKQAADDAYNSSKIKWDRQTVQQYIGGLAQMLASTREHSRAMFNLAKGAAYAEAIINALMAASKALKDYGWPWGIVAAAAALAQGYVYVNQISSTKYREYAGGGYTGPGGRYEPAGIVHRGEVVWSQDDVRKWGGVNNVEKLRTKSFDVGGVVGDVTKATPFGNVSMERRLINLEESIRDLQLTAELDSEKMAIIVESGRKHLTRRTF